MTDRRIAMLVLDEQLVPLGRIARVIDIAAICSEPFDQFDNRIAVAGLKSDESLQQSQAFNGLARWRAEFVLQFCDGSAVSHLAVQRKRNDTSS